MRASDRPDELTPREREVFGLLRLGLTNEEIAERLGISLDGAKYHVSQILSKLGVATREEAAALTLAEQRGRWWVMLPLAAKAAGVAVVLAAVAGLGLLAWGVLRTSGGADGPAVAALATPVGGPRTGPAFCVQAVDVDPSREQAAASVIGDAMREIDRVRVEIGASDNVPDTVDIGCPIAPELRSGKTCPPFEQLGGLWRLCGRSVAEPGRYTLLVYILPQDEIDRVAGRIGARISGEEYVAHGDNPMSSSMGLYLGSDEATDTAFIRYWLYAAMGLACYRPDDAIPRPLEPASDCHFPYPTQ